MPAPQKISNAQREMLVEWMEGHQLQARATQLGGSQSKQHMLTLWAELSSSLNAVGDGVTKSAKEWRQYWSDLKSKVKRKGSALRQHGSGTGGGPPLDDILSPMEQRILALIGIQNVIGNENVRIEVDMGLDILPPMPSPPPPAVPTSPAQSLPSVSDAGLSPAPLAAAGPSQALYPPPVARPRKRKHVRCQGGADADNPPAARSRPQTAPTRWALELEERRVREAEALKQLEERRVAVQERLLAVEEQRLAEEAEFRAWRRQEAVLQRQREEEERIWRRDVLSAILRVGDNLLLDRDNPSP